MSANINTFIGILLDVSDSMKDNVVGGFREGGVWMRSIFQVIDDLIKYDVSSNNFVFALGVGASCGNRVFDLISTLEQFQSNSSSDRKSVSYDQILDRIVKKLENGRTEAKNSVTKTVIARNFPHEIATLVLRELERNPDFVESLMKIFTTGNFLHSAFPLLNLKDSIRNPSGGTGVPTSGSAVQGELLEKVKCTLLKTVSPASSIFSVQKAFNIVRGCEEKQLSATRIEELMEIVSPFIYGSATLFKSMELALKLFLDERYRGHKKLLFVLSDGKSTDTGDTNEQFLKFRNADITVVSCYITKKRGVASRRLHSVSDRNWEEGAKFLFDLSSTIPTQLLPRTIFIKRGWTIDIRNNETKLFLHVNHPDHVSDACDLARSVVCSQDALSEVLVSVSLDIYINQNTTGVRAPNQEEGTCYANAVAAVLHMAMKRILGRQGGYPDFNKLRQELIKQYGKDGADTLSVLEKVCPLYRLRCRKVDSEGAMRAVTAKRPVVARFRLTDPEWAVFRTFYKERPTSVLTKDNIDISKRKRDVKTEGHAVVFTSYDSKSLRFMNSWGADWGDMGFFKVQEASVIRLEFFDVYWEERDLTCSEKEYYAKHGSEVAAKLMKSLKSLQDAEYQCRLCSKKSLVTEFTGQLLQAKCPKCQGTFRSDEAGNILALNMYLLSLSDRPKI